MEIKKLESIVILDASLNEEDYEKSIQNSELITD